VQGLQGRLIQHSKALVRIRASAVTQWQLGTAVSRYADESGVDDDRERSTKEIYQKELEWQA
jgi:hypothetical protein